MPVLFFLSLWQILVEIVSRKAFALFFNKENVFASDNIVAILFHL